MTPEIEKGILELRTLLFDDADALTQQAMIGSPEECLYFFKQWGEKVLKERDNLAHGLECVIKEIEAEISRRPQSPNTGKRGCVVRLREVLSDTSKFETEYDKRLKRAFMFFFEKCNDNDKRVTISGNRIGSELGLNVYQSNTYAGEYWDNKSKNDAEKEA